MGKKSLLFLLITVLFLAIGCKKEEQYYSYGIYKYSGGPTDLYTINEYFTEKDAIVEQYLFTDKSESKLDEQAIASYEEHVAKINENELALQIQGKVSFVYAVTKLTDDGSRVYLREKEYKFNQD